VMALWLPARSRLDDVATREGAGAGDRSTSESDRIGGDDNSGDELLLVVWVLVVALALARRVSARRVRARPRRPSSSTWLDPGAVSVGISLAIYAELCM
jgi:hypothetical protein